MSTSTLAVAGADIACFVGLAAMVTAVFPAFGNHAFACIARARVIDFHGQVPLALWREYTADLSNRRQTRPARRTGKIFTRWRAPVNVLRETMCGSRRVEHSSREQSVLVRQLATGQLKNVHANRQRTMRIPHGMCLQRSFHIRCGKCEASVRSATAHKKATAKVA